MGAFLERVIAGYGIAIPLRAVLVALGTLARKHLTPLFMTTSILIGNVIVMLVGVRIILAM